MSVALVILLDDANPLLGTAVEKPWTTCGAVVVAEYHANRKNRIRGDGEGLLRVVEIIVF